MFIIIERALNYCEGLSFHIFFTSRSSWRQKFFSAPLYTLPSSLRFSQRFSQIYQVNADLSSHIKYLSDMWRTYYPILHIYFWIFQDGWSHHPFINSFEVIYSPLYLYKYIYIFIYIYIYMYIYICIYTYIYTYTYIRIFIYYMYIHITHRHTYENNSLK